MCNELLELAEILEPGASIFRGKLLIDLQEALRIQTKRKLNDNLIPKVDAQVSLAVQRTSTIQAKSPFSEL